MKQLITATASIILILALLVELVNIQMFYISILRADYEVYSFADMIRADGYISEENEKYIIERLSDVLGCSKEDIVVDGTKEFVSAGEFVCVECIAELHNIGNSWLIGASQDRAYKYDRKYFIVSSKT